MLSYHMNTEPLIIDGDGVGVEYPTLVTRFKSTFIDLLVVILAMGISSFILDKFDNVPDWVTIVLFVGIWIMYEPLCTSLGATVGNLLMGVGVRRVADTDRRISFPAAVFRYAFKTLLGWVSFLTIHSNKERRAIHDMVGGSVVVLA